jgi:EAL domain-containing protein (putative c-di-GMP-specific phosphodiesterase class I)/ActR/RegA family two-component response regulator
MENPPIDRARYLPVTSGVGSCRIMSTELNSVDLPTRPLAYVLDDDREVTDLVSRMLAACGFHSREFADPIACLQTIRDTYPEARPNVVVLDLSLRQSDAVDVIRQLERLRFAGKILLISGCDASTLNDVQEIGVVRGLKMLPCLNKPFQFEEFKACLSASTELPSEGSKQISEIPKVDLEQAFVQGWLELWYQPKINLKALAICGAEALLRVRHPRFGILTPASFMPAVGAPILTPVSKFVMKQSMADWKHYFASNSPPVKLAINIPLSVLVAPGFIQLVRSSLPSDGQFPGLIIEATEGEIVQDLELAREVVTQLTLYNISLSIDDFGSAYSSFSRLRDLSAVELKIDSSFVLNCSKDRSKRALCQGVVDLAHRFGAVTCAEGVENHADLKTLIDINCDIAQGFLFAKPQTAQSLRTLLARPVTDDFVQQSVLSNRS